MALPDVLSTVLPNHYEGSLDGLSAGFVQARLDEVVDKIEARWGTLVAQRLSTGTLKPRLYEAVVCRLATRVFRNPEGYRSETEGQYQYSLSAAVASGTIWFTDDDQYDLTGVDPKGVGAFGTATIGRHRPGFI